MPASGGSGPKRSQKVLASLVIVVGFVVWRISSYEPFVASRELPGELAKAKGLRLATQLSDLPSPATPSTADNAADDYRRIAQATQGKLLGPLGDIRVAVRSQLPEDVKKATAERHELDSVMSDLRAAAKKPVLDFAHDRKAGYGLTLTDENVMRALCTVERWDAEQAWAKSDLKATLQSADTMAHIAGHLSQEPILGVSMLRAAILNDLFAVMEPVVYRDGSQPGVRSQIRAILAAAGPIPNYRQILMRELPGALDSVAKANPDVWHHIAPTFAEFGGIAKSAKLPVLGDAYRAKIVRFWCLVYEKLPKETSDLFGARMAVQDAQETQEGRKEFSYGLSKLLYDEYASSMDAVNAAEARRMLLVCALDWSEGKRGALPVDPNSGKAFKQKPGLLYGVSTDEKDNSGSTKPSMGGLPEDIVVRLPK